MSKTTTGKIPRKPPRPGQKPGDTSSPPPPPPCRPTRDSSRKQHIKPKPESSYWGYGMPLHSKHQTSNPLRRFGVWLRKKYNGDSE